MEHYNARSVAHEFTQEHGIDYDVTYAPVVKMVVLALIIIVTVR